MCEISGMEILEEGVLLQCPDCGEIVFVPLEEFDEILLEAELVMDEELLEEEFYDDEEIEEMIEEDILEEIIEVKDWLVNLRESGDIVGYVDLLYAYEKLLEL